MSINGMLRGLFGGRGGKVRKKIVDMEGAESRFGQGRDLRPRRKSNEQIARRERQAQKNVDRQSFSSTHMFVHEFRWKVGR